MRCRSTAIRLRRGNNRRRRLCASWRVVRRPCYGHAWILFDCGRRIRLLLMLSYERLTSMHFTGVCRFVVCYLHFPAISLCPHYSMPDHPSIFLIASHRVLSVYSSAILCIVDLLPLIPIYRSFILAIAYSSFLPHFLHKMSKTEARRCTILTGSPLFLKHPTTDLGQTAPRNAPREERPASVLS